MPSFGACRRTPRRQTPCKLSQLLAYAWTSDSVFKGARWPPIIIGGDKHPLINILCYVSLAICDIPVGLKWACLIMMGSGFGLSGLCFAWAHEICSDDNEERALVTATMNEMAYVCQAWVSATGLSCAYTSHLLTLPFISCRCSSGSRLALRSTRKGTSRSLVLACG